jgi:hypothetical protein
MCTLFFRAIVIATVSLLVAPASAFAQQNDEWRFTLAPFYLWAMETNGTITARSATVPVFLDFADAADNLGGAFSFHFEAHKNKWGGFVDLNFVRLSTETDFDVQLGNLTRTIEGDFNLDITFFEVGASYEVYTPARVAVIGGVRSYSLGAELEFSGAAGSVSPLDASRTSTDVFVGMTLRPALSPKWSLLGRGDIGGGSAEFTWSGMVGLEFRPRPSIGLVLGYKGYGIDVGSDDGEPLREYDMTHYGPMFGLNLHWGR